jgi:hypothetical protein
LFVAAGNAFTSNVPELFHSAEATAGFVSQLIPAAGMRQ